MDLYPLLLRLLGALWGLAFIILVGFTLEQYFPAQREPPLHNSFFKIRVLLVFSAIGVALAFGMAPLLRTTVAITGDGASRLTFGASIWARAAQLLAGLLIFDFFYYWLHRLQHKWSVLWQEHKLHHADRSERDHRRVAPLARGAIAHRVHIHSDADRRQPVGRRIRCHRDGPQHLGGVQTREPAYTAWSANAARCRATAPPPTPL